MVTHERVQIIKSTISHMLYRSDITKKNSESRVLSGKISICNWLPRCIYSELAKITNANMGLQSDRICLLIIHSSIWRGDKLV